MAIEASGPRRVLHPEDARGFLWTAKPRRAKRGWWFYWTWSLLGVAVGAAIFWGSWLAVVLYAERVGW